MFGTSLDLYSSLKSLLKSSFPLKPENFTSFSIWDRTMVTVLLWVALPYSFTSLLRVLWLTSLVSTQVWCRLSGHPISRILAILSFNKFIVSTSEDFKVRVSCCLGKSSKLPFQKVECFAGKPLVLIHRDVRQFLVCFAYEYKYYFGGWIFKICIVIQWNTSLTPKQYFFFSYHGWKSFEVLEKKSMTISLHDNLNTHGIYHSINMVRPFLIDACLLIF